MRRLVLIAITSIACRRDEPVVRAESFDAAPVKTAEPAPSAPPSDSCAWSIVTDWPERACIRDALAPGAKFAAAHCGWTGSAKLRVTFAKAGTVSTVESDPPIGGAAGACVRKAFSAGRVPPFSAPSAVVGWSFYAP